MEIGRCPNGDLLIHSVPADRGAALLAVLQEFDGTFDRKRPRTSADAGARVFMIYMLDTNT